MSKKTAFTLLLFIILSIFGPYYIYALNNYSINLNDVNKTKANKLMIVAHPDDELIWGGGHLVSDKYLVVCITCGFNEKRTKEFTKAMMDIKTEYVMLGYPDLVNGEKSLWTDEKKDIMTDLEKIIKTKQWDLVVTHNSNGEYGHIHHILTNNYVTEIVENNNNRVDLYYFGKYYTKNNLEKLDKKPKSISNKEYDKKMIALSNYKTQNKVLDLLNHMLKYEDWTKYNN